MPERPTPDATRREGVPARLVRLADGADWGFLRPSVRLSPKILVERDEFGRPTEKISVEVGFGYPAEIQDLITILEESCRNGSIARQYESFFTLAVALLRHVHEISRSTACELLTVSEDDLPRLVRDIVRLISVSRTGQAAPVEETTFETR